MLKKGIVPVLLSLCLLLATIFTLPFGVSAAKPKIWVDILNGGSNATYNANGSVTIAQTKDNTLSQSNFINPISAYNFAFDFNLSQTTVLKSTNSLYLMVGSSNSKWYDKVKAFGLVMKPSTDGDLTHANVGVMTSDPNGTVNNELSNHFTAPFNWNGENFVQFTCTALAPASYTISVNGVNVGDIGQNAAIEAIVNSWTDADFTTYLSLFGNTTSVADKKITINSIISGIDLTDVNSKPAGLTPSLVGTSGDVNSNLIVGQYGGQANNGLIYSGKQFDINGFKMDINIDIPTNLRSETDQQALLFDLANKNTWVGNTENNGIKILLVAKAGSNTQADVKLFYTGEGASQTISYDWTGKNSVEFKKDTDNKYYYFINGTKLTGAQIDAFNIDNAIDQYVGGKCYIQLLGFQNAIATLYDALTTPNYNTAPVVTTQIPEVNFTVGQQISVDLSSLFIDEDNDILTLTADVGSIAGTTWSYTPTTIDTVYVTITADDGNGGQTDYQFSLKVNTVVSSSSPGTSSTVTTTNANTGDNFPVLPFIIVVISAVAVVSLIIKRTSKASKINYNSVVIK